MDREGFFYLFVHANGLAELGLHAAAADLPEADPAISESGEVDLASAFQDLDMDALDGLDFFGGEDDAPDPVLTTSQPDLPDPPPAAEPTPDAPAGDPDLDRYVASSYAFEEQLEDRIDAAYEKADLAELDALLARLPADHAPLTGRMSGTDFGRWLELYEREDEALVELLRRVRLLDT
jgi:hypothetical protein